MPRRQLLRLSRPAVSLVAALGAAAGACGGRIVDDLPPLPPPSTPPIVAVNTATPAAAQPAPPPAPSPRPASPPPPPARPAPPAPPPDQISEPAVACALSGRAPFALNTIIQNAEGKPIARLSGADVTVSVSQLTLAARPRARIATGDGFRVRGLVDAAKLPVVTTATLPIRPGHLFIGERRGVSIQKVERDRLTVQREAMKPLQGTFTAVTTCGALSLDPGTPPGWSPPGSARGYAQRQLSLELYDAPGGASVGALRKAPDQDAVLFFSTEESGGYVHIERHADIVVDAWVRTYDVSALPRGETMDQLASGTNQGAVARLAVPGVPRIAKPQREVPLRAVAQDNAAVIGSIAPGTEVYLVDTMAGWVSVLPRALDVMPAEGGQFWAKKTDLGL